MKLALGRVCAVAAIVATACGGEEGAERLQKEEPARAELLSTSCVGIMPPAAPASWTHVYSVDSDSGCGRDTSDASGNVMLERTHGPGGIFDSEEDDWDVFTTVGHQRGAVRQFDGARMFPQEWGFMTLGDHNGCGLNFNCKPDLGLRAWTANGALIRSATPTFEVRDVQLDLNGGVALVGLRPQQPFTIVSQRFDPHGNPLAFQAVVARGTTQPQFVVTGVSVSGLSLVLWNGDFSGFPENSIVGRWVNRFGQAVTGTFLVARNAFRPSVTPLVDGSVAIQAFVSGLSIPRADWVALVRSGSTSVSPVPAWLAAHSDVRVFIVRGGRAYALLSPIDPGTCGTAHVTLFATAGNRCGEFDVDSGAPGPTCAADPWGNEPAFPLFASNIGRDGTLFVRGVTGEPGRNCKDRVFPALLR
ncbi:MAG: hypothetical protein ACJ78V_12030 [Myxococcales bacterium]